MAEAIRVNFSKPVPLFPLPDAVLLPHGIQPLHIFEPRYCQMIDESLDAAGQIAMACFASRRATSFADDTPPIRPAVCIGQIVEHKSLMDGQHYILLHGVCRARIVELIEPDDERLYRTAMLEPLEALHEDPPPMDDVRRDLRALLMGPRLKRMCGVNKLLKWFDSDDVPTHALLELLGFTLVSDHELRYRLLEEADPSRRASLLKSELTSFDHLVKRAERQEFRSWPKGMSWN